MKKMLIIVLCLFSISLFSVESRLKDLVTIKGVRENPLIGYGLVIGLNGTGDGGGEITNTSLLKMFQKLGLNPQKEISSKNVAAVIVTAKMPPFARMGQKMDILVSSIGDSSSLAGGTLLVTPLKGGDSEIYAIASGPVSIGGLKQGAKMATTATIPDGGVIEKEIFSEFDKKKSLRLALNHSDFTTAARIVKIINQELGGKYAFAKDSSTIDVIIPAQYEREVVALVSILENFQVHSDQVAKIVINERTGTIVMGGEVVLMPVAISHGDLSISVGGEKKDKKAGERVLFMDKKTTVSELVKGLNALGVTPEDLIAVFQALKKSGSLIAEIEMI